MIGFLRRRGKQKTARATEKTRKTWFGQVASLFRGPRLADDFWEQLEELLISADVGVGPTQHLLGRLRERVGEEGISQPESALAVLKGEMVATLRVAGPGRGLEPEGSPFVVLVAGVNGVGKTTSIAKLAHMYKEDGKQVLLGAADTFRAAAIEQLQAWGRRVEVDVIAGQPGADPGAVAFDTLQAAISRRADVVIIDTAGRLHTKVNLMEELKKVRRVLSKKVDEGSTRVLLTLDATTGQNGLAQARSFIDAVSCDGVFLAKLDGTAKGGMVLAITHELNLPILYIGTGEQLEDIAPFDVEDFVNALFEPSLPD